MGKLKLNYMKKLMNYLFKYKVGLVIAFFMTVANQILCLILPEIMAKIVNIGIMRHGVEDESLLHFFNNDELFSLQTRYIMKNGIMMLLISLVGIGLMFIHSYIMAKISSNISFDLRNELYGKILELPLKETNKISKASLINRVVGDTESVKSFILLIPRFVVPIVLAIGGTVAAVRKSLEMSWAILGGVLVLCIIILMSFSLIVPKMKKLKLLADKFNLIIKERVTGIVNIRTFGCKEYMRKKFDVCNKEVFDLSISINKLTSAIMPFIAIILNFISVMVIWIGAKDIESGIMNVGDIMAFLQYLIMTTSAFLILGVSISQVPQLWISVERVFEILDIPSDFDEMISNKEHLITFKKNIKFNNVNFGYESAEHSILKDINLDIKKGEKIGIVGATGSGKSTFAKLVTGLYRPTKGTIYFDDKNISDVLSSDNNSLVSYVSQNSPLFRGTIRYNLTMGSHGISEEKILLACQDAQIIDFVQDNGLEKEIKSFNSGVSGGQRQRLSIARALLKDSEIYVFDDCFSKLDFKTEIDIQASLAKRLESKNVFVISQRVMSVKNMDRILVFDSGRIIACGTHEYLLKNCVEYEEMYEIQVGL